MGYSIVQDRVRAGTCPWRSLLVDCHGKDDVEPGGGQPIRADPNGEGTCCILIEAIELHHFSPVSVDGVEKEAVASSQDWIRQHRAKIERVFVLLRLESFSTV